MLRQMHCHFKVERLENKEPLHEYFLLDLALVLIDSIDQVYFVNVYLVIWVLSG